MVNNKIIDVEVKKTLNEEKSKAINMYYRVEGTFTFALIAYIISKFFWDTVADAQLFLVVGIILNFILMIFFLWRHLKYKKVL